MLRKKEQDAELAAETISENIIKPTKTAVALERKILVVLSYFITNVHPPRWP